MKTRFTLDPTDGEFKDRNGNSIGVITAITVDLIPGALEARRDEAQLRKALWERAGYACEHCHKGVHETPLFMHHRTYERLGHELLEDVELLCRDCHKAEHARLTAAGTPLRRPNRRVGDGSSTSLPSSTSTAEGETVEEGRVVGEPKKPTASQLERAAVDRAWEHWLEVSGRNQKLDSKRERIIRNALATVKAADKCDLDIAEAKVMLALTGLSLSPWHRGENEQRKKYMEIRYALKGPGDESDDERIEKACDWASVYAPGRQSTLDPDKAMRYLEEVREYCGRLTRDPNATTGRDRAVEALKRLRAAGYEVDRIPRPPWARFA